MTITELLKIFLSNTYALMLKTHAFHWNVMGPDFREAHLMFEEQYRELFEAADVVAERIRALGDPAPGGLRTFSQMSSIDDPKAGFDTKFMLEALIHDHQSLAEQAKRGIAMASRVGDDATADILIDRIRQHEKQTWMMSAILGRPASALAASGKDMRRARRGG